MTLLSRKADYALLILSFLHRSPDGGNAREIAAAYALSRAFVANILKDLCQKGFVASHRGVKGGYALLRPAATVTLAELLSAVEDGFQLTVCSDHADEAPACDLEAVCPMRGPLVEIHRRLTDVLKGVTLAELFAPGYPAAAQELFSLAAPRAAAVR